MGLPPYLRNILRIAQQQREDYANDEDVTGEPTDIAGNPMVGGANAQGLPRAGDTVPQWDRNAGQGGEPLSYPPNSIVMSGDYGLDPYEPNPDVLAQSDQPFDIWHDGEATDAMLPTRPLPAIRDTAHPAHNPKISKLMALLEGQTDGSLGQTLLAMLGRGIVGGLAGAGAPSVGAGFHYGQQAVANLQALQMRRQQAQDWHRIRQAQAAGYEQRNAAYPQQQADVAAYRAKQIEHTQALIDKAKRVSSDKYIGQRNGSDGRIHYVFRNSEGDLYEVAGGEFWQKPEPEKPPAAPHTRVMGAHTYQWDPDASDHKGRKGGWRVIGPAARFDENGYPLSRDRQPRAPQSYFARLEQWKGREMLKVQRDSGLSDEEKLQHLQEVQDYYESAIQAGGGSVEHFDFHQQRGAPQLGGNAADPLGIR